MKKAFLKVRIRLIRVIGRLLGIAVYFNKPKTTIRRVYIDRTNLEPIFVERMYDYHDLEDLKDSFLAHSAHTNKNILLADEVRSVFLNEAADLFVRHIERNPHLLKIYERERPDHFLKDVFYSVKLWLPLADVDVSPIIIKHNNRTYARKDKKKAA